MITFKDGAQEHIILDIRSFSGGFFATKFEDNNKTKIREND